MVLCPPHGDNSLYASKGDLDLQTPSSQRPQTHKEGLAFYCQTKPPKSVVSAPATLWGPAWAGASPDDRDEHRAALAGGGYFTRRQMDQLFPAMIML